MYLRLRSPSRRQQCLVPIDHSLGEPKNFLHFHFVVTSGRSLLLSCLLLVLASSRVSYPAVLFTFGLPLRNLLTSTQPL